MKKLFKKSKKKKVVRGPDSDVTREAWGVAIMCLGLLLFVAVLTYDQRDPTFFSRMDNPDNQYENIHNALQIVGSTIAYYVFRLTFGYPAVIFPAIIIAVGMYYMLGWSFRKLVPICILALSWAFFLSILLAMRESLLTGGYSITYYPSGLLGGLVTDVITRYSGRVGLGMITGLMCLVLLMISFRFKISIMPRYILRHVQKSLYVITRWFENLFSSSGATYQRLIAWGKGIQWLPENRKGQQGSANPITTRIHEDDSREVYADDPVATPPVNEEDVVYDLDDLAETPDDRSDVFDMGSEVTAEDIGAPTYEPVEEPEDSHFIGIEDDPEPPVEAAPPTNDSPPESGTEIVRPHALAPAASNDHPPENNNTPVISEIESHPEVNYVSAEEYERLIADALAGYENPPAELLHEDASEAKVSREELMQNADLLENTLAQFGVKAFVKKVIEGPVITMYAVRPAEGVKINQVVSLADDLALAMRAKGIRMIAPIPGEAAIGIEIPNRRPSTVYFKTVVQSEKFQQHTGQLVLGMGKTISGEVFCADLTRMPHLLIAGATGAGKSVGINTILASIIYRVPPSDVKFVLIDPKKLELSLYAKLKDHYLAICPDIDEIVITHPQNAILVLRSVVNEMEERYDTLAKVGVRDIISYNQKIEKYNQTGQNNEDFRKLPYIVVVIDELADLILTASREVEEPITRLAQMARAVGIHLIVATQRPSVDILTGLIKANFPTRIAYQVATRPDSKVILDMFGAEKLIGNGDMLFLPPGTGKPVRLQNPLISTEEVEKMIKHVRRQPKFPPYELTLMRKKTDVGEGAAKMVQQDELFDKAREIVVRHQQGSVSLLQRKLKVGYARAGRLMDSLEEAGVVGPGQGSKAREVLVSTLDGPPN